MPSTSSGGAPSASSRPAMATPRTESAAVPVEDGACCGACAQKGAHAPSTRDRPVMTITLDPTPDRSLVARRAADRRVTMLGMALAAGYVVLTVISLLAPAATRMGAWLPLHLLLAGAAATAVAGVM